MVIAVRYDTQTGNTKKLADAIAAALGVEAKDVSVPLEGKTDLMFLGSSVYAAGASQKIKDFIAFLNPDQVGEVACFSTAALLPSTYRQVSRLLQGRGIAVRAEEFHCRGQFHFMHRGKPDAADLQAAAEFARKAAGDRP